MYKNVHKRGPIAEKKRSYSCRATQKQPISVVFGLVVPDGLKRFKKDLQQANLKISHFRIFQM